MLSKRSTALLFVFLFFFIPGALPGMGGGGCALAQEVRTQAQNEASAPELDQAASSVECRELVELLQQQKSLISRETGRLNREIAALREDVSKPGLKEVFAGLGYIFGLAGIGLYIHGLKERRG